MATPARGAIRAAGVVLTRGLGNHMEVAVIHRRRQRDWSLPKGKLEGSEHSLEAAVRECIEETGFTPVLDVPLATQHYKVDGNPKVVDYWRASVVAGKFTENREVDRLRWLSPREATRVLTYPHDADLVVQGARMPPTIPFMLLRHTSAERRDDWAQRTGRDRDDPERGLLERGRWEAERLVPMLRAYGIRHLHSSTAQRCQATLRPTATSLGTGIGLEPLISEEQAAMDAQPGHARTLALFNQPWPSVMCSHRPVIPGQLDALRTVAGGPRFLNRATPGSFYVFHRTWVNTPVDPTVRVVGAEHVVLPPETV